MQSLGVEIDPDQARHLMTCLLRKCQKRYKRSTDLRHLQLALCHVPKSHVEKWNTLLAAAAAATPAKYLLYWDPVRPPYDEEYVNVGINLPQELVWTSCASTNGTIDIGEKDYYNTITSHIFTYYYDGYCSSKADFEYDSIIDQVLWSIVNTFNTIPQQYKAVKIHYTHEILGAGAVSVPDKVLRNEQGQTRKLQNTYALKIVFNLCIGYLWTHQ